MIFERCVYEKGYRGREITPRRIACAKRTLAREAEKVSLFPELAPQETPEQRLGSFSEQEAENGKWWRQRRAQDWRRARRALDAMPVVQRRGLIKYFTVGGMPKTPTNLLVLIDQAHRFNRSFWRDLRILRVLQLVGAGRLPRSMVGFI